MFARDVYFDNVRESMFGGSLTQQQVDGQTVILAVWEYGSGLSDVRQLAYMLATVYKECAGRMWPITEYGAESYLKSKSYYPYIGRGFVQLTWDYNYERASKALGLVNDRYLIDYPELALDSLIATRVMFRGMTEGWFTGRYLDQYFNSEKDDPVNARQIINGNDCDEEIASYHDKFLFALHAAEDAEAKP